MVIDTQIMNEETEKATSEQASNIIHTHTIHNVKKRSNKKYKYNVNIIISDN